MAQPNTYALYAWGNYLREAELDRVGGWLAPAVLSGELVFENPFLVFHDTLPLRVDAARSWYLVGDAYVRGRDLETPGTDWRIAYLRLATDGTEADALRWIERIEEGAELDRTERGLGRSDPLGDVVAVWEDPHGQSGTSRWPGPESAPFLQRGPGLLGMIPDRRTQLLPLETAAARVHNGRHPARARTSRSKTRNSTPSRRSAPHDEDRSPSAPCLS